MGKALNLLDAGDRADNVSVLDAVRHALGANYGKVIDVFRDIDAKSGDGLEWSRRRSSKECCDCSA